MYQLSSIPPLQANATHSTAVHVHQPLGAGDPLHEDLNDSIDELSDSQSQCSTMSDKVTPHRGDKDVKKEKDRGPPTKKRKYKHRS